MLRSYSAHRCCTWSWCGSSAPATSSEPRPFVRALVDNFKMLLVDGRCVRFTFEPMMCSCPLSAGTRVLDEEALGLYTEGPVAEGPELTLTHRSNAKVVRCYPVGILICALAPRHAHRSSETATARAVSASGARIANRDQHIRVGHALLCVTVSQCDFPPFVHTRSEWKVSLIVRACRRTALSDVCELTQRHRKPAYRLSHCMVATYLQRCADVSGHKSRFTAIQPKIGLARKDLPHRLPTSPGRCLQKRVDVARHSAQIQPIGLADNDLPHRLPTSSSRYLQKRVDVARHTQIQPKINGGVDEEEVAWDMLWNIASASTMEAHITALATMTPSVVIAVPSRVLPAVDEKLGELALRALLVLGRILLAPAVRSPVRTPRVSKAHEAHAAGAQRAGQGRVDREPGDEAGHGAELCGEDAKALSPTPSLVLSAPSRLLADSTLSHLSAQPRPPGHARAQGDHVLVASPQAKSHHVREVEVFRTGQQRFAGETGGKKEIVSKMIYVKAGQGMFDSEFSSQRCNANSNHWQKVRSAKLPTDVVDPGYRCVWCALAQAAHISK
ncbi:hypothetical protein B0H12DRAFT_1245021 [Mycena haematopus]|nr:hypothetical protein B0H12DRAFT_1245021 [Mycena haematopus]